MLYVVSYDISNDHVRLRVGKCLEGYGRRVQRSVFECEISSTHFARVKEEIAGLINKETDNVRYYRLCAGCAPKFEFYGQGAVENDDGFFII